MTVMQTGWAQVAGWTGAGGSAGWPPDDQLVVVELNEAQWRLVCFSAEKWSESERRRRLPGRRRDATGESRPRDRSARRSRLRLVGPFELSAAWTLRCAEEPRSPCGTCALGVGEYLPVRGAALRHLAGSGEATVSPRRCWRKIGAEAHGLASAMLARKERFRYSGSWACLRRRRGHVRGRADHLGLGHRRTSVDDVRESRRCFRRRSRVVVPSQDP